MDNREIFNDLRATANADRLDFLKTDLDLCFTFADVVETELRMDDLDAALRVLAKAEKGHETISTLMDKSDPCAEMEALRPRLARLRRRLDHLQRHMQTGAQRGATQISAAVEATRPFTGRHVSLRRSASLSSSQSFSTRSLAR